MAVDERWAALGAAVIRRRVELGMPRQKDLAERIGKTAKLTGMIERGERSSYASSTIAALEMALRWAPGSVDAILAGGEPTELPKPVEGTPDPEDVGPTLRAASKWELLAELARRLEEGGRRGDAPDLVAGVNYPRAGEVDDTAQAGRRHRRPETG